MPQTYTAKQCETYRRVMGASPDALESLKQKELRIARVVSSVNGTLSKADVEDVESARLALGLKYDGWNGFSSYPED